MNIELGDRSPLVETNLGYIKTGDEIHHHHHYLPSLPPAIYQLPSPSPHFTGREEELDELRAYIANGGKTCGVFGMGGVGKTELALKLAHELSKDYPDGQFFLDLKGDSESPLSTADAMRRIIYAYYPREPLPENEDHLASIYRAVLHDKCALLLIDNAKDVDQVEPLVPPGRSVILVTSRNRFILKGLAKNLEKLPPKDACELLLRIAPRIADLAGEIASLCGYLPLALWLAAGAFAIRNDLKPADYVRRLRTWQQQLELIEASLSTSYELLDEKMQKMWRTLAVFPDSFEFRGAAALWKITEKKAHDELGKLMKFSLVEWTANEKRYRLHDLSRVFAYSRLSNEERIEIRRLHAMHYRSVLQKANEMYKKGGESILRGLALFDSEWINIKAGQAWAQKNVERDDRALKLCDTFSAGKAVILNLRQHPQQRILWLEIALDASRRLHLRNSECGHLANLGNAYRTMGEARKAIEFYEEALEINREDPPYKKGEASTLSSLGLAYTNLGEVLKAIKLLEQALKINRELPDKRGEGQTLNSLGRAYAAMGELGKAIEFYEQALEVARTIPISDRRTEGMTLNNLGEAYVALGDPQKAVECCTKSLEITRDISDWRSIGIALNNLGNAYRTMGRLQEAIKFYEQALEIARTISHRRTEAYALYGKALAFDSLGSRKKGIPLVEEALQIYEQIEDPHTSQVRDVLKKWCQE